MRSTTSKKQAPGNLAIDFGELDIPIKRPLWKEALRPGGPTQFGTYEYLEGAAGSRRLEAICNGILARKSLTVVDLETTGLDPHSDKIVLVSFTTNGVTSFVFNP